MMDSEITEVFVCMNVDCKSRGAEAVFSALKRKLGDSMLDTCKVAPYLCFSACNIGPNVVVASKRCWFSGVQLSDLDEVVDYLRGGDDIPRLKTQNDPDLEQMIFDIIDAGLIPDTKEIDRS